MKVQHGRRLLAGALISAFAVVAAPADAAKVARPSITKVSFQPLPFRSILIRVPR